MKSEPTLRRVTSEVRNRSKRYDEDLLELLYRKDHSDSVKENATPFDIHTNRTR